MATVADTSTHPTARPHASVAARPRRPGEDPARRDRTRHRDATEQWQGEDDDEEGVHDGQAGQAARTTSRRSRRSDRPAAGAAGATARRPVAVGAAARRRARPPPWRATRTARPPPGPGPATTAAASAPPATRARQDRTGADGPGRLGAGDRPRVRATASDHGGRRAPRRRGRGWRADAAGGPEHALDAGEVAEVGGAEADGDGGGGEHRGEPPTTRCGWRRPAARRPRPASRWS